MLVVERGEDSEEIGLVERGAEALGGDAASRGPLLTGLCQDWDVVCCSGARRAGRGQCQRSSSCGRPRRDRSPAILEAATAFSERDGLVRAGLGAEVLALLLEG